MDPVARAGARTAADRRPPGPLSTGTLGTDPLGTDPLGTGTLDRTTARQERALRLWTRTVPLVAVLLAGLARLVQWAGGRSLWLDEALIAESLTTRGFAELVTEPLLNRQAAPVLWLWAERLCVQLLGDGERALRLVPLLAGLAVLALAAPVARRVLPPVLAPVAVLLVAVNPQLLYYANEVKQYSSDVAVTLLVVLLALRVRRERDLLLLAAAGSVAVWASHVAVLPLAGVSLALALRALRAGGVPAAVRTGLLLSPWLLSLAVAYVLVLAPVRDNGVLSGYWGPTFPSGALDLPAWLVRRALAVVEDPLSLTPRLLGLALVLAGAVQLVRHRPVRAGVVGLPLVLGVLAAALSAYPLASRLALWTVPLVAVVLAAAVPLGLRGARRLATVLAAVLLVGTSLPAAASSAQALVRVQLREELGPVVDELSARLRPGDLVLPDVASQAALGYYGPRAGVRADGVVLLAAPPTRGAACEDPRVLQAVFAQRRVWVVSSHVLSSPRTNGTRRDLLARIGTVSRVGDRIVRKGAQAVLFDPAGADEVAPAEPNPRLCLVAHLVPAR